MTVTNWAPYWFPLDNLTVSVSYFQQHETHELKLLNGEATNRKFNSRDIGETSTGEFGGILTSIFNPASQTPFRWKSGKDLNSPQAAVHAYEVEPAHSSLYVETGQPGKMRRAIVGFHGTVEIDRDTGEVIHPDHVADHIPPEPGLKAVTEIDYDVIEAGGARYLVPVDSQTTLGRESGALKGESEFRDYPKFEVGSKVDFGAAK